jgi:Uma2 family endonuclease
VEVLSPSDCLAMAQSKMAEWIGNGAELAWLIDGDARKVHICRPDEGPRCDPESICSPAKAP